MVASTAHFNSREARYARNAVRGPSTTEDGPCPKGTRPSAAMGMKIKTNRQMALREVTRDYRRTKLLASICPAQLCSYSKDAECPAARGK
jgi:hypothetical protein